MISAMVVSTILFLLGLSLILVGFGIALSGDKSEENEQENDYPAWSLKGYANYTQAGYIREKQGKSQSRRH